jgi:hypothetical protein
VWRRSLVLALRYRLRRCPSTTDLPDRSSPETSQWLKSIVESDEKSLRNLIHDITPSQYGNVGFHLHDNHKPSVSVRFQLINASVFTLIAESVQGKLQIEHDEISGEWEFVSAEIAHGQRFNLTLRWVIGTPFTRDTLQRYQDTLTSVHLSLDNVKFLARTEEAPDVVAEVRFPQQWWTKG